MDKDKIIIFAAILLGFFVLWFIFFTDRTVVEEPDQENNDSQQQDAPWRRETREPTNNRFDENDDYNDFEMDLDYDFTPPDEKMDLDYDLTPPGEGMDWDFDLTPSNEETKRDDSLQEKVNECLSREKQRYQDILDLYLNEDSLFYVGDDDYLEYFDYYKRDYDERRAKCHQLYLTE